MSDETATIQQAEVNRRRSRRVWLIVSLIAVTGVATGGWGLYRRYFGDPKRFAVVEPGVLYRSAQPKPAQISHVIDEYHIKTIVVVRDGFSKAVPQEAECAAASGARVVYIPVVSRAPIPDDQIREFLRIVDDPQMRPVLVHCSAGRHRTGLMCAMYRIERQGWSVDRALEEMASFGFNLESQTAVYQQLKAYRPGRFAMSAGGQTAAGKDDGKQD